MQERNSQIIKDRDISFTDYFSILQSEYLSYRVRSFIYTHIKDISRFNEFAEKKKSRILKISDKHFIKNIFTDEDYKVEFVKRFFNEWGLPSFNYRDDYQKTAPTGRKHWDKEYYFKKERKVRVKTNDGVFLGEIISFDCETNTVIADCNEKGIFELDCNYISVIFGDKFYKNLIA